MFKLSNSMADIEVLNGLLSIDIPSDKPGQTSRVKLRDNRSRLSLTLTVTTTPEHAWMVDEPTSSILSLL